MLKLIFARTIIVLLMLQGPKLAAERLQYWTIGPSISIKYGTMRKWHPTFGVEFSHWPFEKYGYEELPQHIALPRGCLPDLESLVSDLKVKMRLEDQRTEGSPLEIAFVGRLTPQQIKAAHSLLKEDIGIVVAPPGMGKTVLGIYLAAVRRRNVLILVHRAPLLDQWVSQLSIFLGVDGKQIGRIVQAELRPFAHRFIRRITEFQSGNPSATHKIQDFYRLLARDEVRNRLILKDVLSVLKEGRSPILLTERKEQLEFFNECLRDQVRHVVILQGGGSSKKRKISAAKLSEIPEVEERVILATGRFVGEGFDDARLDTLFLAAPISWKGTLTQYAGRLNRLHPGKQEVRIYDYVDAAVPMLARMFEKRLKTYRALGYSNNELTMKLA